MIEEAAIEPQENLVEDSAPSGDLLSGDIKPVPSQEASDDLGHPSDFVTGLPEELRGKKSLQSFKDAASLAKSYDELLSKFGKRLTDLTADEIRELNPTLGVPESQDEYNFDSVEVPEGLDIDNDQVALFKQMAFNSGISQDQASKIFDSYLQMQSEQYNNYYATQKHMNRENEEALQKEFGLAFDEKVSAAKYALREFGGDEAIQAISSAGLGSNPAIVKMLAQIGEMVSEEGFKGGDSSRRSGAMTPEDATNEYRSKLSDPVFSERLRRGDQAAKETMEQLGRYMAGR